MELRRFTRVLPPWLKAPLSRWCAKIFDIYAIKSYSQEGEDMILRRIFEGQKHGFYVDVGAHHPRRFSNTHFFYLRGWSGINVEPNPDAIRMFLSARPRDTNLQVGVADRPEELRYYLFDEPALNTFDGELVKWRLANTSCKLVKTIKMQVQRLGDILAKHLPANQQIDFLSIDVEGRDFDVLRSNDWQRFRPKYVLVEALGTSLEEAFRSDIFSFMKSQGYELFGKTFNTLVFREKMNQEQIASRQRQ